MPAKVDPAGTRLQRSRNELKVTLPHAAILEHRRICVNHREGGLLLTHMDDRVYIYQGFTRGTIRRNEYKNESSSVGVVASRNTHHYFF